MRNSLCCIYLHLVCEWVCIYKDDRPDYESKLELRRSTDGDGGLDTELELLLVTLCRDPDCMSTTWAERNHKDRRISADQMYRPIGCRLPSERHAARTCCPADWAIAVTMVADRVVVLVRSASCLFVE